PRPLSTRFPYTTLFRSDRLPVAGHDRRADAAVPVVRDDDDPRIGRGRGAGARGGPVRRGVVDDVDTVDEVGDAGERPLDEVQRRSEEHTSELQSQSNLV